MIPHQAGITIYTGIRFSRFVLSEHVGSCKSIAQSKVCTAEIFFQAKEVICRIERHVLHRTQTIVYQ